jgi:hypothetical protein
MTTSSITSNPNNSPPSQHITSSTYTPNTNGVSSSGANTNNRLLFNRLATERKTEHVMSANLNKDVSKRDRQILASYNNAAAGASPGSASGHANTNAAANTNLTSVYQQNNNQYLNNQSTLEYSGMMTTGRSQTNASTFLQKLSSKFTRR